MKIVQLVEMFAMSAARDDNSRAHNDGYEKPDHAKAAPLCERRYAMKPMPAKPRSSIAHVEGSGTEVVKVAEKRALAAGKLPSQVLFAYVDPALVLLKANPSIPTTPFPAVGIVVVPLAPETPSTLRKATYSTPETTDIFGAKVFVVADAVCGLV